MTLTHEFLTSWLQNLDCQRKIKRLSWFYYGLLMFLLGKISISSKSVDRGNNTYQTILLRVTKAKLSVP